MTIAVLGMLEKRGKEIEYLRGCIERKGHRTIVVDLGRESESQIEADITRGQIAKRAGMTAEEIKALPRHEGQEVVLKGLLPIIRDLYEKGELRAAICLGGTTTAYMASVAMGELPFGVPKFIICSAAAAPPARRWLAKKDIVLMNTVVHVIGNNWMIRGLTQQAAAAVCAMMEAPPVVPVKSKIGTVAMTLYGNAERCAMYVREGLEEKGYQVVSFHAYGPGEESMEDMVSKGIFDAVIDLVPRRVGEFLFKRAHGFKNALKPICQSGIPYILAPGGINLLSVAAYQKSDFKGRKIFAMDPYRFLTHMNKEEMVRLGEEMSNRLSEAKGPVRFIIPVRGWSTADSVGSEMYDPEADKAFTEALRKKCKKGIEIREVEAWLEEQKFAEEIVAAFDEVMAERTA